MKNIDLNLRVYLLRLKYWGRDGFRYPSKRKTLKNDLLEIGFTQNYPGKVVLIKFLIILFAREPLMAQKFCTCQNLGKMCFWRLSCKRLKVVESTFSYTCYIHIRGCLLLKFEILQNHQFWQRNNFDELPLKVNFGHFYLHLYPIYPFSMAKIDFENAKR